MKSVLLSDKVWVKLTELGMKKFLTKIEEHGVSLYMFKKENHWFEFNLSQLLLLFGGEHRNYLGCFEENKIYFDKPF